MCSLADTYSDWLLRTVPRWKETGISQPQHSFDYLFWNFYFTHALQVFQNVLCSSVHILQGIPKRPYIYFCATGRLNGERPCRCCDLSSDVNCFLSYVHDCWQVFDWTEQAAEFWMLSLVYLDPLDGFVCLSLQVVQLIFLRKPKQSCLYR